MATSKSPDSLIRSATSWSSAELVNYVGLGTLAVLTFKLARFLWEMIRVYVVNSNGIDLKTLGDWAVVTGATDGIGKEYALQLARTYRLNVVLISRSADKLEAVAKQIEEESGVKTKCIAVNFASGNEIYERIKSEVEGLNVAVLVNNVGTTPDVHDYIHKHKVENLANTVRVNCATAVVMTKLILPGMLAKRKGAIVNLSSLAAYGKAPLLSTYSATKAFIDRFSQLTQLEYNTMDNTNIIVQTLRCTFVATKLSRWPRLGPIVPDAASYVRSALKTIGVADITTGWFPHEILAPLLTFYMPNWFSKLFMKNYQRLYLDYEK